MEGVMAKQLALNVDGIRSGLLGAAPMDPDYMAGVNARAKMLAKACSLKKQPQQQPIDPYLAKILAAR
jgi:hypothetical protein